MAPPEAPPTWTLESLKEWLLEHARAIMGNDTIEANDDLFIRGFDRRAVSIKAIELRIRLFNALRNSTDQEIRKIADDLSQNVIHQRPTIQKLSERILNAPSGVNLVEPTSKEAIETMIKDYSVGLSGRDDGVLPSTPCIKPAVVLLTGSTGGLGSLLLLKLIESPDVQRVYAFNRSTPGSVALGLRKWVAAKEGNLELLADKPQGKWRAFREGKLVQSVDTPLRQLRAFGEGMLEQDVLKSEKLVYIEADASQPDCGLPKDSELYKEILHSITLIIHNAWRVDFNMQLTSFEDCIKATRNLIDLGLASRQKENLRFLFTSSIASSQGWVDPEGLNPFPEEVQLDPSVGVGGGYGESKYVAERIIAKSGLHATSFRIGQIAGGHRGSWASTDWFPIIVKSSITLSELPEAAGVVSWLRGEDVASVILETGFSNVAHYPVLNVVNPRTASWAEIINVVREEILQKPGLGYVLGIMTFEDWFWKLNDKAQGASLDDIAKTPAIKLLAFIFSMKEDDKKIRKILEDNPERTLEATMITTFITSKAQEVSATMKNMEPIGETEAKAWVSYWYMRKVIGE